MTPRKFSALMRVHKYFIDAQNGKTQEPKTGYIDQIPGW